MSTPHQQPLHHIRAWTAHDLLLETHRYTPGPAEVADRHAHATYQLCLSLDFPGEYWYRGATLPVPVGSLSIIHPGEVHAARDPLDRTTTSTYRMFYVAPELLCQIATDLGVARTSEPFFAQPIITDAALMAAFIELHVALEAAPTLATETILLHRLAQVIARYAVAPPVVPARCSGGRELQRVRDYLHAHATECITLEELAQLAGLSMYHLCRAFARAFGIPPHRYQTLVRIDHAKRLLASGRAPGQVAIATGFSDQSHFGRHFKQVVGVTPAAYADRHQRKQRSAKTC